MREEWITEQWYLAATCRNCSVQFAFQPDGEIDESTYQHPNAPPSKT
jgi:hypothetical protein